MTQSLDPTTSVPLLVEVSDGVAWLRLNRPEAMNSLDNALKDALVAALRDVAEDPAVRCVVLTGTGRAFCVGQDLKEHVRNLGDPTSTLLQNCASDPSMFFKLTSSTQIVSTFQQIGNALANLHLSQ